MTVLALDIGGTAVKSGLFRGGRLAAFEEFPTQAEKGAPHMVEELCGYIRSLAPDTVGISTSGQVNPADGSIAFATESIPQYTGFPLRAYVSTQTNLPVAVENDVNSAAIGEAMYGSAKGLSDFLCVTIGTGIGGALFVGGQLYRGADGIAGEIGHITTHAGGRLCVCGQRGCFEMYASTAALLRDAQAACGRAMNGRVLFAAREDPAIRAVLEQWLDEVVAGLASLTHAFNPQALVLGGGLLNEPEIADSIERRFQARLIPSFRRARILRARLGNRAGIYGAYALAARMIDAPTELLL